MQMALRKGRPTKHGMAMKKTSVMLPVELIERLGEDAEKSGFRHWSEQLRYETLERRGMWQEPKRYLPTQAAP